MIEVSKCPLCNFTNNKIILETTIDRKLIGVKINILRCKNCGHNFTSPITSKDQLHLIYSDNYYSYNHNVESTVKSVKGRLNHYYYSNYHSKYLFNRILTRLIDFQYAGYPTPQRDNSNYRVLDIGCGNGLLLNMLKDVGFKTYGTEISQHAVDIVKNNGHNCFTGLLEDLELPINYFSFVTMIHVLEHTVDPRRDLMKIHKILEPNGELVIVVPNFNYVDRFIFKEYWMALLASEHFQQFTDSSLKKLVESSGFKITKRKLVFRPYLFSNLESYYSRNGIDLRLFSKLVIHFVSLIFMVLLFPFIYFGQLKIYGVYLNIYCKK